MSIWVFNGIALAGGIVALAINWVFALKVQGDI